MIKYDDFAKLDLRIGEVKSAEKIEGTHLLKLIVDTGGERTIVAAIADEYSADKLVGKKIVVVTNLEPRKIRGIESHGMLLAALGDGDRPVLIVPDAKVMPGAQVK